VDGYRAAGIPLETFVSDSQYMRADQDFTLGAAFPPADMRAFVAGLHGRGQRWVRARARRPRGGSARPEPAAAACPCPAARSIALQSDMQPGAVACRPRMQPAAAACRPLHAPLSRSRATATLGACGRAHCSSGRHAPATTP